MWLAEPIGLDGYLRKKPLIPILVLLEQESRAIAKVDDLNNFGTPWLRPRATVIFPEYNELLLRQIV